ncbi:hypothetical protein SLA2020_005220 [Shorea laevis]
MEDDDEFGDLYTDVIRPFSSASTTSSSAPPPPPPPPVHQRSAAPLPAPIPRPIDLNLHSDDNDILYGTSHPNPPNRSLASSSADLIPGVQIDRDSAAEPRVLDTRGGKLMSMASKEEPGGGNDVKFDIEEGNGIDDLNSDPVIPGLSDSINPDDSRRKDIKKENTIVGAEVYGEGEGDDWDSDSEDDLQIVLNDNIHGPISMERGVMGEDDDDDEDEDPLVIVADGDANQGMEEQEWGEEAAPAGEGERKEGGEPGKPNVGLGGGMVVPKIGYSNHGYPPFHSQFKYVRPGAAPMPGATAGAMAPGQVRPVVNMVGRGRGEWRPAGLKAGPPMQKGFHPGFGMTGWGNGMGRGFGGGLEFTLPSHKTIFDVDIDSLEEKPWKYPGVDISDFFNFGLNEESWKDYCRQLEQRRLETTMQSKIRVYESGRAEQDYDPDLPPELAAATGQEVPTDSTNHGKSDGGQNDLAKGTARVRPPLPTGRAIQVEGGFGERLPSIDTRPPRIRDSDAIIEIVCQNSMEDDSSTGNEVAENTENDRPRHDLIGDNEVEDDVGQSRTEYFDGFQEAYRSRKREAVGRRMPFTNSVHDNMPEVNGILPYPVEAHLQYGPRSRGQSPMYPSGNFGIAHDDRHGQGRTRDRSPRTTHSRSREDEFSDNQEESVESLAGMSPNPVRDARDFSVECKTAADDKLVSADGSPVMDKDEISNKTVKDETSLSSTKKQKVGSQVEQRMIQELDEEPRAARSSENSKARSGSSRDYQKWQDGTEDEVVQDRGSTQMAIKRDLDENDQRSHSRDRDGRYETERSQMVAKVGEDSYPKREYDPSSSRNLYAKADGFERQRERDVADCNSQRRDDDPYGRKSRTEDLRKRERDDEIGPRHRPKARETERSDRDDHLHSRKQLDNGSYRIRHDKDAGLRHRERDDNLRSRYEVADDYHSRRRKDEEHLRRDHAEKEEMLHSHRESSSRSKRARDEILDQRKRDEQQRIRENFEEHHSVRHKDEVWLQRERNERQRGREEWPRLKQSHEENLSKRDREEGRGTVKSVRGSEEKAWVGHARMKDDYKGSDKEYPLKETVRHGEQVKRRERVEDGSFSHHRGRDDVYARGNQLGNNERKARQDKSSTRSDRALDISDNQRVHEKKHKEGMRKNRGSEGGDPNALNSSKRNQEDISGNTNINEMGLKSTNVKNEIPVHHDSSRKHREDASSDDEQESRRGRSKLERWTSHKERDFSINSKSSASLKLKEVDKNNTVGSSEPSKIPDEATKSVEPSDNEHPMSVDNVVCDPEIKDADTKPLEDRHLDTVEKLKKRSERFKLPMPIEKDPLAIKKMESEALPSAKTETPTDSEIKPERPARKRRWVSN